MKKTLLCLCFGSMVFASTACMNEIYQSCLPEDVECIQACYQQRCGEQLSFTTSKYGLSCMSKNWGACIKSANQQCHPKHVACVEACYREQCGEDYELDEACVESVKSFCIKEI